MTTESPTATALTGALTLDQQEKALARLLAAPAPTEAQATLHTRFEQLMRTRWADATEHTSLVKAAAAAGELAFVGGRYRAVLDTVPDEPRARAAQQELLNLAMATMSPGALSSSTSTSGTGRAVAVGVLLLVVLGGVVMVMRTLFAAPPGP